MQGDRNRELIRMLVERILEEVFPDETGASRLQQIGLFTIVYALQGDEEPVTAARIAALSAQSPSQIHRQLKKLTTLDIIERSHARWFRPTRAGAACHRARPGG